MPETMMALGDYRFALDTAAYQRLQRSDAYTWPTQSRIGRMAASQFTGRDAATLELSGTIYPGFRGGLEQVDRMRAEAEAGTPLLLVAGTGRVLGKWVITEITETQTVFYANGVARRRDFTLRLQAYGEDQA